mmetsp:Transcript_24227/g.35233  ORF Transcript_24227/g.35233 Transcript_24227/m.35233 type:complete len:91 (-) Transcript_24227:344-616(-)
MRKARCFDHQDEESEAVAVISHVVHAFPRRGGFESLHRWSLGRNEATNKTVQVSHCSLRCESPKHKMQQISALKKNAHTKIERGQREFDK